MGKVLYSDGGISLDGIEEVRETVYLLKRLVDDREVLVGLSLEEFERLEELIPKLLDNVSSENLLSSCRDFIECILGIEKFEQILNEGRDDLEKFEDNTLRFKGYEREYFNDISRFIQNCCKDLINTGFEEVREKIYENVMSTGFKRTRKKVLEKSEKKEETSD